MIYNWHTHTDGRQLTVSKHYIIVCDDFNGIKLDSKSLFINPKFSFMCIIILIFCSGQFFDVFGDL